MYTLLVGKGRRPSKVIDRSAVLATCVRHFDKAFCKVLSAFSFSVNTLPSFLLAEAPTKENSPVRVRYFQMMLVS